MRNGYYDNDPGMDPNDKATDEYLQSEALKENGDVFAGYFDPVRGGDGWTSDQMSPGVTELKIEQRCHRVFLIVCRFKPNTEAEAEARLKAIRRYSEQQFDDWNDNRPRRPRSRRQ